MKLKRSDNSLKELVCTLAESYLTHKFRCYKDENRKIINSYKQYNNCIPIFLNNRPKKFVTNSFKIFRNSEKFNIKDISKDNLHSNIYYVKSENSQNLTYRINFGSQKTWPSCECKFFNTKHILCKHFYAILRFLPQKWLELSPLFLNHPLISVDETQLSVEERDVYNQNKRHIESDLKNYTNNLNDDSVNSIINHDQGEKTISEISFEELSNFADEENIREEKIKSDVKTKTDSQNSLKPDSLNYLKTEIPSNLNSDSFSKNQKNTNCKSVLGTLDDMQSQIRNLYYQSDNMNILFLLKFSLTFTISCLELFQKKEENLPTTPSSVKRKMNKTPKFSKQKKVKPSSDQHLLMKRKTRATPKLSSKHKKCVRKLSYAENNEGPKGIN